MKLITKINCNLVHREMFGSNPTDMDWSECWSGSLKMSLCDTPDWFRHVYRYRSESWLFIGPGDISESSFFSQLFP